MKGLYQIHTRPSCIFDDGKVVKALSVCLLAFEVIVFPGADVIYSSKEDAGVW